MFAFTLHKSTGLIRQTKKCWCGPAELGLQLYHLDRAWPTQAAESGGRVAASWSSSYQAAIRLRVTLVWPTGCRGTAAGFYCNTAYAVQLHNSVHPSRQHVPTSHAQWVSHNAILKYNIFLQSPVEHDLHCSRVGSCKPVSHATLKLWSQSCALWGGPHALVVLKISFACMWTQDAHKDLHKGNLSWITYTILYPSPQPIPDISLNKVGPSQGCI